MAGISKSVIGQISGQLDNLVFRTLNGKRFVSVRPKKYKVSSSASAVVGRENFASAVHLAKSIISEPGLKEIWSLSAIDGSTPYHRAIKLNMKPAGGGSLTIRNKITPGGLPLKLSSASIAGGILYLSFNCPANANLKFPAELFMCFSFEKGKKQVIPLSVAIEIPSQNSKYNLEVSLDGRIKKLLAKDPEPILFIAMAGGTVYKKSVYWTDTEAAVLQRDLK
jgi:hypothetical protein